MSKLNGHTATALAGAVATLTILAVIVAALFLLAKPGSDPTPVIAVIIGLGGPVLTGVLAVYTNQQNGAAIQAAHATTSTLLDAVTSVQSSLDGIVPTVASVSNKVAAIEAGRQATRSTDVVPPPVAQG